MAVGTSSPSEPTRVRTTFAFSAGALVDALAAVSAAGSRLDVATAVCAVLIELDGVRGAAVLQRDGDAALVVGSAGYPCDTMAPGAALPLDSGLPAAEAVKTGRLVVQGDGPSWFAAPFGRRTTDRGALLISLSSAAPAGEDDVGRLLRLATTLGAALVRAARADRSADDVAALLAGLSAAPSADESDVAIRQAARGGALGGDVALCLTDDRGRWLLMADVSGAGLAAASRAAAVRIATRVLLPSASGPAQLLELLDRALRPETPEGGFVTAVAVQVTPGSLRVASAGHHAPVLLVDGMPASLAVEPGQPLALETTDVLPTPVELVTPLTTSGLLVLYSDGLVDRRTAGGELEITTLLTAAAGSTTPAAVADALLTAAGAAGPADDDTSVLVSRV